MLFRSGLLIAAVCFVLLGLKVTADIYGGPLLFGHFLDHILSCVLIFVMLFALTLIHGRYVFEEPEHQWKGFWGQYRGFVYLFSLFPVLLAGFIVVGHLSRGGIRHDLRELQISSGIISERITRDTRVVRSLVRTMAQSPNMVVVGAVLSESDTARLNATLDRYATVVEGSVCYVLDLKGNVVASSNRAGKDSFVGKNYAIRPYFKEAIASGASEYAAMGLTSNVPGFYASAVVHSVDGQVAGVAVIKTSLGKGIFFGANGLQSMLVHSSGIILAASAPSLEHKGLWPVKEADRREFSLTKQFPVPVGNALLPDRPVNGDIRKWATGEALFDIHESGIRGIVITVVCQPHAYYVWQMWGFAGIVFLFSAGFIVILWNEFLQRSRILTAERERNQEELALQMETIFNSAQVGLMLVDSALKVKRINQVVFDMGGQELVSVLGRQPGDALSCIQAKETQEGCGGTDECKDCPVRGTALMILKTGNAVRGAEVSRTIRTAAGEHREIWLEVNATPLELMGERHILFSLSDITERKMTDASLRESKVRFDMLAEHNRVVNWEVDTQGLYTYISHVSQTVIGYHADELVGRVHFYDIHPIDGREAFKQAAFGVFAKKGSFHGLINAIVHKDGRIIWVATSGVPVFGDDGSLRGYRGSDVDITEQKKSEDEKVRHMKELEIFYKASVGREERILELKKEVARLKKELGQNA